jgi:F-type H+-transporting ATPase subunit b
MFLLPDGTFWVQLVNFVIFYAILNVVFMRPVQRAIAKRREYIEGVTRDYDRAQEQAGELRAQVARIHSEARVSADAMLAAGRNEAGNKAAEIAADAAQRAREVVEAAHAQVASEVESNRAQAESGVAALVGDIVGKLLPEARA